MFRATESLGTSAQTMTLGLVSIRMPGCLNRIGISVSLARMQDRNPFIDYILVNLAINQEPTTTELHDLHPEQFQDILAPPKAQQAAIRRALGPFEKSLMHFEAFQTPLR